jgi:5'-nucleotidase
MGKGSDLRLHRRIAEKSSSKKKSALVKCISCVKFFCLLFLLFAVASCRTSKTLHGRDDGHIQLTIVQVNDVYEITPLSGGAYGGLARIATVKKQQLQSNPNTLLVMAGDFLSPSVYNSLKYEGKRIRGRQMVDAMNAAGFDIAVFGNHEFDIKEQELQDRLNESRFQWIASNSFLKMLDTVVPFSKYTNGIKDTLPAYKILTIKDKDGTTARVGFIGIDITSNTSNYVVYTDPMNTAQALYERIKDSCDIVIPITHQTIKEDSMLAVHIPHLPVIIGGHEHDMHFKRVGNVYITKAHANARTAFIIKIDIDKRNKTFAVHPELKALDNAVALDSATNLVVQKWADIASGNYSTLGFNPSKIILPRGDSLEGRETYTRWGPTNLTRLIVEAMAAACPQAEVVIMNSGSIRLDDILYTPVSEYDILRTLPFGGSVREVDMKGELLNQIFAVSEKNRGTGGYLQYTKVLGRIDPAKIYRVALTDFLLTGGEANMKFLNEKNPLIIKVYPEETSNADPRSDIRLAVVMYLLK